MLENYSPFFYVIEFTPNGLLYAGCRTAQNSNPITFMVEGEYQTSSKVVHKLIEEFGLNSFRIRSIKIFETADQAYNYETRFLKKVDAANNPKFLNMHNNDKLFAHGTTKWNDTMVKLYGVNSYSKTDEFKERYKKTSLKLYGEDNYFKTDEYKEKMKKDCMEKYGVEYYIQSEVCKEKSKQTCIEKYGVDNYAKTDEFKERIRQFSLDNYGAEHYSQTEEVRNKYKQTNLLRYGVEYYSQTEEHKEKKKHTVMEKYGVEYYSQSSEYKDQMREYAQEKYGVDHHLKSQEIIDKRRQTNIEKYGTTCSLQNNIIKENIKQICLEKYGVDNYSKTEEYKENMKQICLEKYGVDNYSKTKDFKILEKQRKERPIVIQIYKYKEKYGAKIPHKLYFKKDEQILKEYLEKGSGNKAVGFCCSVKHAEAMAKYFSDNGIPSFAITSKSTDRDDLINKFRNNQFTVAFTVDLFNEGVDFPDLRVLLFLRPTESKTDNF